MSGKLVISLFLIGVCFVNAEIINFSKLEKEKVKYYFKRDLFSPLPSRILKSFSQEEKSAIQNQQAKDKTVMNPEKEIQSIVSFEGFIEENKRILALISINNEFFVVAEGDVILDKFQIIKIDKEKITLEVDTQHLEIQLKGDGHD